MGNKASATDGYWTQSLIPFIWVIALSITMHYSYWRWSHQILGRVLLQETQLTPSWSTSSAHS